LKDYGVNQAKLDALETKIETFRKTHSAPRQRVTESSAPTSQLAKLLADVDLFRARLDRLMVHFKTSAADFFKEYQSARVIVYPPTISSSGAKADAQANPTLPKAA
jgi:hypothetical protein